MDLHRLQELLRRESDRVEWKQSGKNADDVLHPACALANDLGGSREEGFVLFGVNKDGKVIGIDTHGRRLDEAQQQTAGRLTSTAIYPTPSFDLEADVGQDGARAARAPLSGTAGGDGERRRLGAQGDNHTTRDRCGLAD